MTETKLHNLQKELLRKLTLHKDPLRFNDLIIEGIESEHMNYHLQKLMELEFVRRRNGHYELTDTGKDYANLMDDTITEIEKQPKTSVIFIVTRKRTGTNHDEFLLSKRLRQPYYGKVGFLGGKVRFGETLKDAVLRELFEETGLTAKNIKLINIYHKIRKHGESTVQDVIFYRHLVTDIGGEFIQQTAHQENIWNTAEEIAQRTDLFDTFSLKTVNEYLEMPFEYVEDVAEAEDY